MNLPKVYITGPTGPNSQARAAHCRRALDICEALIDKGFAPYTPYLWAAAWAGADAVPYEDWLAVSLTWLGSCEFVLRMPGHSPIADRECAHAKDLKIPVVDSIQELLQLTNSSRRGF